jgi:pyruvate dehydrogenase E1 component alpha subunit
MARKQQIAVPLSAQSETPAPEQGFSLISNQKLLDLYRWMLQCRRLAEQSTRLVADSGSATARKDPLHNEAVLAAMAIDLLADDTVVVASNDLLPGFVKGLPLERFLQILALSTKTARVTPKTAPLVQPILWSDPALHLLALSSEIADRLPIATGVALANQVRGNARVVVVFARDEEAASDAWQECFAFAAAHDLPLLFALDDTPMSTEKSSKSSSLAVLARKAKSAAVPAITVDRNDAVAVYRVACESISRARLGRGPTLILCQRFQLVGRSKTKLALQDARPQCPLANMESYLAAKGLFQQQMRVGILARFQSKLNSLQKVVEPKLLKPLHTSPFASIPQADSPYKPKAAIQNLPRATRG